MIIGDDRKEVDIVAHPGGRPPFYTNVEDMQKAIDQYFESCKGEPIMVEDPETGQKVPYLDKHGQPVLINSKPPTVTGLALALGFTSRQALLNYEGKNEFFDAITRAKMRCQEYAEQRLYDKDGANGAKFSLQNNFGWVERQEITNTNIDVDLLTADERRARLLNLLKKTDVIEALPTTTYSILPDNTDDD
jgi:hypothetical protein